MLRHTGLANNGNFGVEWLAAWSVDRFTPQNFIPTFWFSDSGTFVPGETLVAKSSLQLQDTYRIGEIGPAGGYIFYDKGYYSDGWQYLEAAPAGWSGGKEDPEYIFGYYRPSGSNTTVGTGAKVGSGKRNTELLVQRMGTQAYSSSSGSSRGTYAALIAHNYTRTISGIKYDDWFLPSYWELDLMHNYLHERGIGSFSAGYDWYWSSTEVSDRVNSAWSQRFQYGRLDYYERNQKYRVRPIRSF